MVIEAEIGYEPVEKKVYRPNEVFIFEGFDTNAMEAIKQKLESLKDVNPVVKSTSIDHGQGSRIAIIVVIEHD